MIASKETYQDLTGNLPAMTHLPSEDEVKLALQESTDVVIILDDDPTGTQTVFDIPVLTTWSLEAISAEIERGTPLFYILTNSRSLTAEDAKTLNVEIASNIKSAASTLNKKFTIISRSDSTLRGHYPLEIQVLEDIIGLKKPVHFIAPAFFAGGRYTIENRHYVREGDQMVPAHETPFAQDKVFGFATSEMTEWVHEKFSGSFQGTIHSLSIDELRISTPEQLTNKINGFKAGDVCIVNAAAREDLTKAIISILKSNIDPLYRSAADLVAAFTQQAPKILEADIYKEKSNQGGVIVLGSYVPKSTQQLEHVLQNSTIESIEVNVTELINGEAIPHNKLAAHVDQQVNDGKNVLIYTSRELISTAIKEKNLDIGAKVSKYLTDIVSSMSVKPKFVVGKGGITSSDLATKSLKIKRAMVLGQIIPGVPVWEQQEESKFPGVPYIVFPGNVGDASSLTLVINKLTNN